MPDSTLAFVFDSVEAAEAALRRLDGARVPLKGFELETDVARYGVPAVYPGGQCVLVLRLELSHDEAYVRELVRGRGRLIPVPAPQSDFLNLEVEHLRTGNLWRSITERNVPMAIAAAMVFHTAHERTRAMVSAGDYDDALSLAASALSRLVPVYTVGAITGKTVEIQVNLLAYRFAQRATQLRARQGEGVIEPLFVQRGDVHFALSVIKRAGLPFSFALLPPEAQAKALEHSDPKDEAPD
ncbi:MAG TPA: hypothetical protein VFI86_00400 [Burkholderiales bacterium]|nr:hypothetical protein [Burkholderiales bacterium]